jgi:hypothetical protein
VLHVDPGALIGGQGGVAGDHRGLGDRGHALHAEERRDLALVHDSLAGELGVLLVKRDPGADERLVLEGSAHDPGAADGQPVVREAGGAGVGELRHVGQLVASHPPSHGCKEPDRQARVGLRALAQGLDLGGRVHGRFGVGHRQETAIAARGGSSGAGLDVLLVLTTGRAKVHVGIEERRDGVEALRVDHLGVGNRACAGRSQLGDLPVADHDVVRPLDPRPGIKDGRALQDQVAFGRGARTAPVEAGDRPSDTCFALRQDQSPLS